MTELFSLILDMSLTASYIAIAVIAARLLLGKAPKVFSYVLWLAVLIRLVFPFSFGTVFSFFNLIKFRADTGTLKNIIYITSLTGNPAAYSGSIGINSTVEPVPPAVASVDPIQVITAAACCVWIAGMAFMLVYSVLSYFKIVRGLRTATLIKDNIFETDRIVSPFICGLFKPKIYLPREIGEKELSYILAHEQVHIMRRDYLIKPLAFVFLVIHWFNPIIWLSFGLMSRDMEMSCDESVVRRMGDGVKRGYSLSLLSFPAKRSGLKLISPLAFGESGIKSRIKNILNYKKPAIWIIVLVAAATVFLLAAFTTDPPSGPAPEKSYYGYFPEILTKNKTPYAGNNSRVIALIDAMPMPEGAERGVIELQTASVPYGITINVAVDDLSDIQDTAGGDILCRNAVMLLGLVGNADIVTYRVADGKTEPGSISLNITYTREKAEKLLGRDIRSYAADADSIKSLIDKLVNISFAVDINGTSFESYETYTDIFQRSDIIESSPATIVAIPAPASSGEETEIRLPDYKAHVEDPVERLLYDTLLERYSSPGDGFLVVAPKIYGKYKEGNKLKVFTTFEYARYKLTGKVALSWQSGVVPAAVTYAKEAGGGYRLDEFMPAKDGGSFRPSIKEFCTMPVSGKVIVGLYSGISDDYDNSRSRSAIKELLNKNLIQHLNANNQEGIYLEEYPGSEPIPLT